MNLYISGSNRKNNSYKICKDLKNEDDKLIALADLDIKYCLGCSKCQEDLESYCVLDDDMKEIYEAMLNTNKIIICSPIYMDSIPGILKNVIDRLNPFCCHELLKSKKVYLITVGQLDETENQSVAEIIKAYFEDISEFFEFDFTFLKNLSSGDINKIDNIQKNYDNYNELIEEMKKEISK